MDPTPYLAFAAVLVIVGLAGTVLPFLPGILFVCAGLVVAAWAEGYTRVGAVGLSIIAVLALLGFAADLLASLLGAKRAGASGKALFGAATGGVVGVFFGIPGMLLGPFLGAVAGELWARGGLRQAGKVGIGTWLGLFFAAIAKVVIAFMMIATFFAFYVLGG